jgi:hypothetical protein
MPVLHTSISQYKQGGCHLTAQGRKDSGREKAQNSHKKGRSMKEISDSGQCAVIATVAFFALAAPFSG